MNLTSFKSLLFAAVLGTAALAIPSIAQAQSFVRVQQQAPVFAGPGYQYPQVGMTQWNQNLRLYGCLQEIAWCDVQMGYTRGWIDADNLLVYRGHQPYSLYQSRSWFTYPIISFIFGDYWDRHYRHSSWYGQRHHYSNWDWRRNSHHWNDRRNDRRDDRRRNRNDHRWDNRGDHDRNRGNDRDRNRGDRGRNDDWRNNRPENRNNDDRGVINRPARPNPPISTPHTPDPRVIRDRTRQPVVNPGRVERPNPQRFTPPRQSRPARPSVVSPQPRATPPSRPTNQPNRAKATQSRPIKARDDRHNRKQIER